MTILQRAATIAAMTFALAGTLAHSAPGYAENLGTSIDRAAVSIAASSAPAINTPTPVAVPALDAPTTVDTATTFIQPLPVEPRHAIDEDYDSLADAIAAQDTSDLDAGERCLAGAIYFEARGEPLAGQLAVAHVIVNRSKSGRFPSDICSVIKQRGQFSFVRGGEIPTVRNMAAYHTAAAIAKVAIDSAWDSPADKALYFNSAGRSPGGRLVRVAMIGNHVFYR